MEAADKAPHPEATKLLADARAARACWTNFPGFTADLEVNFDGQVVRGRVQVNDKGKVEVKLEDEEYLILREEDVLAILE